MYPTAELEHLDKPAVQEIVSEVMSFAKQEPCKTDEEVEKRIKEYFKLCKDRGIRPGIEQLCLYLGISRVTLFNWAHGNTKSKRKQELALMAKQVVIAYIESATLSGRLNPASSCFLLKNWAQYKDSVTFEASVNNTLTATKTPEELAEDVLEDIPVD